MRNNAQNPNGDERTTAMAENRALLAEQVRQAEEGRHEEDEADHVDDRYHGPEAGVCRYRFELLFLRQAALDREA